MLVAPLTNLPDRRFVAGCRLVLDGGEVEVTAGRPHGDRWIVTLSGVSDRTAAERLNGTLLHAEPLDDSDVVFVHELIGSEVVCVDGRRVGEVVSVEANPAHDLLVLADGTLIPVVFITEQGGGTVTIDPPDGLV